MPEKEWAVQKQEMLPWYLRGSRQTQLKEPLHSPAPLPLQVSAGGGQWSVVIAVLPRLVVGKHGKILPISRNMHRALGEAHCTHSADQDNSVQTKTKEAFQNKRGPRHTEHLVVWCTMRKFR